MFDVKGIYGEFESGIELDRKLPIFWTSPFVGGRCITCLVRLRAGEKILQLL